MPDWRYNSTRHFRIDKELWEACLVAMMSGVRGALLVKGMAHDNLLWNIRSWLHKDIGLDLTWQQYPPRHALFQLLPEGACDRNKEHQTPDLFAMFLLVQEKNNLY